MFVAKIHRVGKGILVKTVDAVSAEHNFTEGTVVENVTFTKADSSTVVMSLASEGATHIQVMIGEDHFVSIGKR